MEIQIVHDQIGIHSHQTMVSILFRNSYDYYINKVIHKEIVDELRLEFPSTKIFTIPTGWATTKFSTDESR